MDRRASAVYFLALVTIVLALSYRSVRQPKHDIMTSVSMLDVGQGDSFLIQARNGTQLLIDGGKDDKALIELSKLMPRGDSSIDVVIATHPDADHIGGLPLILDRYDVGLFLTSQVFTDTEIFRKLFEQLAENAIQSYFVRSGMKLSLDDDVAFTIVFPDRDTSGWETNAASVVGRLQVGERSMLLTGDAPSSVEASLTEHALVDVDILKLGHHGSKTSSSEEFLQATSPVLALVSAGVNNRYGHPAGEVLERLQDLDIPWLSTQDQGTVTFKTDGMKWYTK